MFVFVGFKDPPIEYRRYSLLSVKIHIDTRQFAHLVPGSKFFRVHFCALDGYKAELSRKTELEKA